MLSAQWASGWAPAGRGQRISFPPARRSLENLTSPNSTTYYFWKGVDPKFGYSGVTVKNIAEAGGNITADFSFEPYTK